MTSKHIQQLADATRKAIEQATPPDPCGTKGCWFCDLRYALKDYDEARSRIKDAPPIEPDHKKSDHKIIGTKEEQAMRILGRHLCGWISGHTAPIAHFDQDAAMIIDEIRAAGIQFI